MNKLELMKTANEVRKGIVTAVHSAKAGHPGGSLSAADIFTCPGKWQCGGQGQARGASGQRRGPQGLFGDLSGGDIFE